MNVIFNLFFDETEKHQIVVFYHWFLKKLAATPVHLVNPKHLLLVDKFTQFENYLKWRNWVFILPTIRFIKYWNARAKNWILMFVCSADGNYEVRYKSNVLIYPDGEVLWVPPAIYQSSCTIDVTYFPFDQQTCIMKFGSWTFTGNQVSSVFEITPKPPAALPCAALIS